MNIRDAIEIVRDWAGLTNRASNEQVFAKVDAIEKHGDHDQTSHGRSGSQRYNDRTDRIMSEARRLEADRVLSGEEHNPSLTDSLEASHGKYYMVGSDSGLRVMYRPSKGQTKEMGRAGSREAAKEQIIQHHQGIERETGTFQNLQEYKREGEKN